MNRDMEPLSAIYRKALAFCRDQGLLQKNDRVIVAVSGGADSMALLLFFMAVQDQLQLSVSCVHVNHCLRGTESDEDERYVEKFCKCKGIKLYTYNLAQNGISVPEHATEEWARQQRYALFDRIAAEQCAKIATAHTMNDQAETLLFRLARGCGLEGAGGIHPVRGPYIRPFLSLSREETEQICRENQISFCTDHTNLCDDYARNRLRHHALPAMVSVNAGAVSSLAAFCERSASAFDYMNKQAESLMLAAEEQGSVWHTRRYCARQLMAAHEALLPVIFSRMAGPDIVLSASQIGRIREVLFCGGAVQVQKNAAFRRDGDWFYCHVNSGAAFMPFSITQGVCAAGNYQLSTVLEPYENCAKKLSINKKYLNYYADYDKITATGAIVRTRLPGDSFSSGRRKITKPLRKWFQEWNVPREERAEVPLLAAGSRVLWVYGAGFASGLEPEADTRQVITIHCGQGDQHVDAG